MNILWKQWQYFNVQCSHIEKWNLSKISPACTLSPICSWDIGTDSHLLVLCLLSAVQTLVLILTNLYFVSCLQFIHCYWFSSYCTLSPICCSTIATDSVFIPACTLSPICSSGIGTDSHLLVLCLLSTVQTLLLILTCLYFVSCLQFRHCYWFSPASTWSPICSSDIVTDSHLHL